MAVASGCCQCLSYQDGLRRGQDCARLRAGMKQQFHCVVDPAHQHRARSAAELGGPAGVEREPVGLSAHLLLQQA